MIFLGFNMAKLSDLQKREREVLERLSDALDKRAHDINEFSQVLASCLHLGGVDPLPHLKEALRNYLIESK